MYISVSNYNKGYDIKYINSLSKYHVQDTSEIVVSLENKRNPDLLMDFDGLLGFVEYFCGFELTANKRQHVYIHKKDYFTPTHDGYLQAMSEIQGTYTISD